MSNAPLKSRIWIYIAGYAVWVAFVIWSTSEIPRSIAEWVNAWHRWDAQWYFDIWNLGYGADPRSLVFPPGYSWIVGSLSALTNLPFDVMAMMIGISAHFASGILATELISRRFQLAWWAVYALFLSVPVGFYAFVPYSDMVFEVIFWSLLWIALEEPAERPRWHGIAAWALMFLAPWIRLTGYALGIWLLFRRWFAVMVLPALALFLGIQYALMGDPLHFLHAQLAFAMPSGWFLDGLKFHWFEIMHPPRAGNNERAIFWLQINVLPCISLVLLLITSGWLAFKKQWMLLVTVLTVALFSRNQAYWRSVLRYDLPLMPLLAVPWLDWAKGQQPMWKRWPARAFFFALIALGLILNWGFARRLHVGAWAF